MWQNSEGNVWWLPLLNEELIAGLLLKDRPRSLTSTTTWS